MKKQSLLFRMKTQVPSPICSSYTCCTFISPKKHSIDAGISRMNSLCLACKWLLPFLHLSLWIFSISSFRLSRSLTLHNFSSFILRIDYKVRWDMTLVLQLSLGRGVGYLPLAATALTALQMWGKDLGREFLNPYYKDILPLLQAYLSSISESSFIMYSQLFSIWTSGDC